MRANDFLTEAALAPKTFYVRDRLQTLINRLKTPGEKFLTVDGDAITVKPTPEEIKNLIALLNTNYDAQGTVISNKRMPNVIGGVPLSQLMKTTDFGGKSGVGAGGESEGKPNIGPTVEALKSMAMFAKLIARGKPAITAEDVQSIGAIMAQHAVEVKEKGKNVATTESKYSRQVYDTSRQVKDTIRIEIKLSSPPFQRAVNVSPADKKAWGTLQGIVKYVNDESDIAKYSRFFANNNKRDPVSIAVVGISGAKADIQTTYTKPDGTVKELSHMSMSIKAGSSMYDQASAMNEDGMTKFYEILGLNPLDAADAMRHVGYVGKRKGEEDAPEVSKNRIAAVRQIYEIAATQLESRIASLNDQGEAEYIHEFLGKLKNSIQGEGKLVYVNFDAKGTYNKLNPQLISSLARNIDLTVELDTTSKSTPYLYLKDKISGKPIMHVRLAVLKSGRMTNTFELDYLLDIVSDAKKHDKEKDIAAQDAAAASAPEPATAKQIKLGPPNAAPAKVPTKAKTTVQQPQVGDQMGAEPEPTEYSQV